MEVFGFEHFGLSSLRTLVALGSRRVIVGVYRTMPSLLQLVKLNPSQRRRLVAKTYREKLARLLAAVPSASRVLGSSLLSFRADTLSKVPDVQGLGPLYIAEIEGRRKRKLKRKPEKRCFAVRIRWVEQVAGKDRGFQHAEDRIVTLFAFDAKEAERKARRHFNKPCYSDPYVDSTGDPIRWRIDRILGARPVVLHPLEDGVTTVWTEGHLQRLRPDQRWNP